MNHTSSIDLVAAALVAAIHDLVHPHPRGVNPRFKSRYIELGDLTSAVRAACEPHGLAVLQMVEQGETNHVSVRTVVIHQSGQYIESTAFHQLAKGGIQDLGAAVTYLRRYALAGIFGIAGEPDDDGESLEKNSQSLQARVAVRANKDRASRHGADSKQLTPQELGAAIEFDLGDLGRFLAAHGRPYPMDMTRSGQGELIDWMKEPESIERVALWCAANPAER